MSRNTRSLFVSCLALSFSISGASAGLVTWEFEGVITSVDDSGGLVSGIVDVGSPFSGAFTFDLSTPDTLPDSLTIGRYDGAISDLSGEINGLVFSGPGSFNIIAVFDRSVDGDDLNIDIVDLLTPSLGETSNLSFILGDTSGAIFDNDSLPNTPPIFDVSHFRLSTNSRSLVLDGEITSVVPEPTAFVLLLAGIGLAAGRRKRGSSRVIPAVLFVVIILPLNARVAHAQWAGGPVLIGGDITDENFANRGEFYIREGLNFLDDSATKGVTG